MKTKKKIYIGLIAVLAFTGLQYSCTKLEVETYSLITPEAFSSNPDALKLKLVNVYADLKNEATEIWYLNEFTTDEMFIPARTDGFAGNPRWHMLQSHTYDATSQNVQNSVSFTNLSKLINDVNIVVFDIEKLNMEANAKKEALASPKMLRAYAYYQMCDFYGRCPIINTDTIVSYMIPQSSRKEIYYWMEQELKESVPYLSSDKIYNTRVNKYAGFALQAKLYINAQVFTDGEVTRWDECIAACDSIIKGGYELDNDYFHNFTYDNNKYTKENILVASMDNQSAGMSYAQITLHSLQAAQYTISGGKLQNGLCAVPSFIKEFKSGDLRKNGWKIGVQKGNNGDTLKFLSGTDKGRPLNFTVDFVNFNGTPVNYLGLTGKAQAWNGARFYKYTFENPLFTSQMSNDFPIFRYSDFLLLKAEAIMRKNGGNPTQEALDLVNKVRNRSFTTPRNYQLATFTLDSLLLERKFELYGEGHRRNDLIRYGQYENVWKDFPNEVVNKESYRRIFPIPDAEIQNNPLWTQNTGY